MTSAALVRTFAAATLLAASAAAPLRAEDGYDLWLRYRPIADQARLGEYRAAFTSIVVEGTAPSLRPVRD